MKPVVAKPPLDLSGHKRPRGKPRSMRRCSPVEKMGRRHRHAAAKATNAARQDPSVGHHRQGHQPRKPVKARVVTIREQGGPISEAASWTSPRPTAKEIGIDREKRRCQSRGVAPIALPLADGRILNWVLLQLTTKRVTRQRLSPRENFRASLLEGAGRGLGGFLLISTAARDTE